MPVQEPSWASNLPTLEGLLANDTGHLVWPFSIFSISLFRPTPSLPPPSLLDALAALSARDPTDPLYCADTVNAVRDLQRFATQMREAVASRNLAPEDGQVTACLETLLRGYAMGCHAMARVIWGREGGHGLEISGADMQEGVKQCVHGIFVARVFIAASPSALVASDKEIIGAIFPPTATNHHLLSPLFEYPRQLITSLQAHPIRPLAHTKLTPASSPLVSPLLAQNVTDAEVTFIMHLLEAFVRGVGEIEALAGPSEARNAKDREEERRRPLRVAMEAKVLHCDLAMSMTTKRITEVKARTARRFSVDREDTEVGAVDDGAEHAAHEDVEAEGVENDAELRKEVEDLRPDVLGDEEGVAESSLPTYIAAMCEPEVRNSAPWEETAEKALEECLDFARALLEDGRAAVLSDEVVPIDWLGYKGVPSPLLTPDTERKSKSPSGKGVDSDSDSEYNTTDSESESSHASETDLFTHACPLRSLFSLIDRYEEQRLAVWLSLPTAKRGKMAAFMCGGEGRVGMAWDSFGLRAMMEYDGDTLLSYGLAGEKLDKWTELAAVRNAKKIRRKGRKTV